MKYTIVSVADECDISAYLNQLNQFNILREKHKSIDKFNKEKLEFTKYTIDLIKPEDFFHLTEILEHNIIIQDYFYNKNHKVDKESTIAIMDDYID